eukprot:3350875-Amphidinium_carterae.1
MGKLLVIMVSTVEAEALVRTMSYYNGMRPSEMMHLISVSSHCYELMVVYNFSFDIYHSTCGVAEQLAIQGPAPAARKKKCVVLRARTT